MAPKVTCRSANIGPHNEKRCREVHQAERCVHRRPESTYAQKQLINCDHPVLTGVLVEAGDGYTAQQLTFVWRTRSCGECLARVPPTLSSSLKQKGPALAPALFTLMKVLRLYAIKHLLRIFLLHRWQLDLCQHRWKWLCRLCKLGQHNIHRWVIFHPCTRRIRFEIRDQWILL